jgi:hypothetical protein
MIFARFDTATWNLNPPSRIVRLSKDQKPIALGDVSQNFPFEGAVSHGASE